MHSLNGYNPQRSSYQQNQPAVKLRGQTLGSLQWTGTLPWHRLRVTTSIIIPVPVDVGGTEGVAVVQQRGVDQCVVLRIIHQVLQVAQVTVAASNTVPSTVLVQDEHLTRTEPPLIKKTQTPALWGF